MTDKMFKVNIRTPDKIIGSYEARLLICPATDGEIGVMADHMPMLCALNPGVCRITTKDGVENAVTGKGILFVKNNTAEILCE